MKIKRSVRLAALSGTLQILSIFTMLVDTKTTEVLAIIFQILAIWFAVFSTIDAVDMWRKIWWRVIPGPSLRIKWPDTEPNEAYRGWLENNVGRQLVSWDWTTDGCKPGELVLKLSRIQAKKATVISLMWG